LALDYRWIEDLIDTDPKAMGVYLALLHLRLRKGHIIFPAKPSGSNITNETSARNLFYFYLLAGKGEVLTSFHVAETFIDRLFAHEDMLYGQKRNLVLEDIECKYYHRFVSAFKKYLRLNVIPKHLREMVKNMLLDIRGQPHGKITRLTRCGTVVVFRDKLADYVETYYGVKGEMMVGWLISILVESRLAYSEHYRARSIVPSYIIIPSLCLLDEILELIVKGGVKPEIEPPTSLPIISPSPSKRVENLIRAKPSREVLEGIVASVLEDLGFKVSTNVRLEARRGSPIEVDVWAQRVIGRTRFSIYVSCKNWDRAVDRSVIDEEAGRVMNLRDIPQLKVLIAKELTEPAREAAEADGFMVIELGRKAEAENSKEIYEIVYKAFNELFTAIAPPRLREITEKLVEIKENLRKIEEEITRLLYR
jgi:hypothetical protein